MNEKLARQLVNDYVEGWEKSNESRILSALSKGCLIIESHGPTYYGLQQVKRWVKEWYQAGKVESWEITSFYFVNDVAFFEWLFTCTIDDMTDSIEGSSIVKFKDNRICYIHEYRMTNLAFDYFPK